MNPHYDIIIIGSGAGGGTIAHALRHRRADPDPRTRRLHPSGAGELESRSGLETSPLPDQRALARRAAVASSGRIRTTASAGTRSSGAACCIDCGAKISRRSQHADGVSPAWPITYETLAPYYDRAERLYHVRGQHGVDPTELPRGPYPYEAVPHAAAMAHIVARLRASGPASVAAAARDCCGPASRTAASCATRATRFRARSTRRATPKSAASATRRPQPNVTLWTGACARRLITDARGAKSRSR